jgi:hypothetical protein
MEYDKVNFLPLVMQITKSIYIFAPPEVVFRTISNVPLRLSLNPFWRVVEVRKLTPGKLSKGTRFRIRLRTSEGEITYTSECIEVEENRKIRSRAIEAGFEVLLSVREVAGGTLLTHTEMLKNGGEKLKGIAEEILEAWLENVKRYSELRNSRLNFLIPIVRRWLAINPRDRELLKAVLLLDLSVTIAGFAALLIARVLFTI